ncbi:MAG: hypothetical protein ABEJ95_01425 [Candidatus Nanohalobium sp.]
MIDEKQDRGFSSKTIPMDHIRRQTIEKESSGYEVNVEYREGEAEIYGPEEDIQSLLEDVEQSRMGERDHRNEFGEVNPDVFSYLEKEDEVVADGGFPSYDGRRPIQVTRRKEENYNELDL